MSSWKRCLVRGVCCVLRLRPHVCRECSAPVGALNDVCSNCGAGSPVQIPRWIGLLIAALTVQQFLLLKPW